MNDIPREREPQPGPFGCRLIVLCAAASLVLGLVGAGIGVTLFDKDSDQRTTEQRQAVTVQEDTAVIEAVKKVSPAVVSITVTGETESFFGPIESKGGGTGFIITNDGLIATNKHVAQAGNRGLTVVTNDGKTYPAEVKTLDPTLDLALIKIDAKNLPVADIGNSDTLQIGQTVIAIGNALGEFQNTVTQGVLSAKERTIQAGTETSAEQLDNLLQTDAAINPGNSGGPLVNLSGQVIGINTAVAGDAQGIGFAIAINQAKQGIDSFQQKGKIVRPSLGVRYRTLTPEYSKLAGLPSETGALLIGNVGAPAIVPGGAAAKADLHEGDIIVAVDGTKIDDSHTLSGLISRKNAGDEVELTILRQGKEQKVRVRLEER